MCTSIRKGDFGKLEGCVDGAKFGGPRPDIQSHVGAAAAAIVWEAPKLLIFVAELAAGGALTWDCVRLMVELGSFERNVMCF